MSPLVACLLLCSAMLHNSNAVLRCAQVERQNSPVFQLVRRCSRSAMSVVAQTNVSSVRRCADFAYSRRALALNYRPRGARRSDSSSSTCLVLQCPEFQGLGSLHRDEGYDYYSMYFDPLPHSNWSCVPGVGMFRVRAGSQRANFTAAGQRCRDDFGDLAHLVSEARTQGLSALLNSTRGNVRRAFANLNDMKQEGLFVTSAGTQHDPWRLRIDEPLACFPYRAWGPGEPRNRSKTDDCVVLDRRQAWAVANCATRLPFVCELFPAGGDCGHQGDSSREQCAELRRLQELRGSEEDRCEGWDLLAVPATTTTIMPPATPAQEYEDGGGDGGDGEVEGDGETVAEGGQDQDEDGENEDEEVEDGLLSGRRRVS